MQNLSLSLKAVVINLPIRIIRELLGRCPRGEAVVALLVLENAHLRVAW